MAGIGIMNSDWQKISRQEDLLSSRSSSKIVCYLSTITLRIVFDRGRILEVEGRAIGVHLLAVEVQGFAIKVH